MMSKGKAFSCSLLCFLLITVALLPQTCAANNQQTCAPSSCGKITNITHPFRLKDDPAACGDPSYELACEDNTTVLYLFSGKYYVQAINYKNFTIRLVDPGISEADFSSIPHYFLSSGNFTYPYDFTGYNRDSYEATQKRFTDIDGYSGRSVTMFQHVVYLNCSKPVRDDPQYVDTASCINCNSKGHVYAIAGGLPVVSLKADCRVKLVAASSFLGPREYGSDSVLRHKQSISYAEIHRMLSYGFDVSWMRRACADHCGQDYYFYCYFNETRQNLDCGYPASSIAAYCHTPLGFHCGNMSKLRIIAEDSSEVPKKVLQGGVD